MTRAPERIVRESLGRSGGRAELSPYSKRMQRQMWRAQPSKPDKSLLKSVVMQKQLAARSKAVAESRRENALTEELVKTHPKNVDSLDEYSFHQELQSRTPIQVSNSDVNNVNTENFSYQTVVGHKAAPANQKSRTSATNDSSRSSLSPPLARDQRVSGGSYTEKSNNNNYLSGPKSSRAEKRNQRLRVGKPQRESSPDRESQSRADRKTGSTLQARMRAVQTVRTGTYF